MSMPNDYPGLGEPFDHESAPNSLELLALIEDAHKYLNDAKDFDASVDRFVDLTNHTDSSRLSPKRYVRSESISLASPAEYLQMLFVPDRLDNQNKWVQNFYARFTELPGWAHGVATAEPVRTNDILLEIVTTDGNDLRYLVNGSGVHAYPDGESLQYDNDAIERYVDALPHVIRPDIYSIAEPYWLAPALLPAQVQYLFDTSTPQQH